MTLTHKQEEQIFLSYSAASIDGVTFRPHADRTVSRACRRGSQAAQMADITYPHPTRGRGWCIAVNDLAKLMPAILGGIFLGLKMWLLIQPHLVYALMLPLVGVA